MNYLLDSNSRTFSGNPQLCQLHPQLCKQVTCVRDTNCRKYTQPSFSVLTTHYSQTSRQPYCIILLSVLTMSNPSKKPRLEHFFRCRNSHCPKPGGFTTEKGIHIHYGKSPHCGAHAAACQAYIRRNSIVRSPSSPSQPLDIANNDLLLPSQDIETTPVVLKSISLRPRNATTAKSLAPD
jgi:hypothetical protein